MRSLLLVVSWTILLAIPATATTYLIRPDGTGDFPTIQAAIDVAVGGDIIELADGTFNGDGNRDIDYLGKAITIRSQGGDPENCVIDCEGSYGDLHRGFRFHSGEDLGSGLESVSITNGLEYGAGIACQNSSPTLTNCILYNNTATDFGAGASCRSSSPVFSGCTFRNNTAHEAHGGGMFCDGASSPTLTDCRFSGNSTELTGGGISCGGESSLTLINCTFISNSAGLVGGGLLCNGSLAVINCTFSGNQVGHFGGAVYCYSSPTLTNCIIAFSEVGQGVDCSGDSDPTLICCDVYGNEGGDWVGCIENQYGIDGNISEDPLFCDVENSDFTLCADSPCASENNSECGQIGAWPVGCDPCGEPPFPTLDVTWGQVKHGYR
jgi:parallel beta-helix repeat protein/predicted outer membrane repeat protein